METEKNGSSKSKRKTVCVTIGNQKGGTGKSTTTIQLATALNYHTNFKVAVVDVDPQHSAIAIRETEKANLKKAIESESNDPLKKAVLDLKAKGKGYYPIFPIEYKLVKDELLKEAKAKGDEKPTITDIDVDDRIVQKSLQFRAEGEYDVVFFDFPGYTGQGKEEDNTNLYARLLRQMEFVIVPFHVDVNTQKSTVTYLKHLVAMKKQKANGNGDNDPRIIDFGAFMWKYSLSKNTKEFNSLGESLKSVGIKVFDSKVYDSNEFQMNFSSIRMVDLPGDKSLVHFMNEFINFCNLK